MIVVKVGGHLELDYDAGPNQLTGQYYTDRMTAGTIRVRRVAP